MTGLDISVEDSEQCVLHVIHYIRAVPACLSAGTVVACILTCFNFYRLMVNYIEHYQEIRRGDYKNVHVEDRIPRELMVGNLNYQAYQTSYFIAGFVIQVRTVSSRA